MTKTSTRERLTAAAFALFDEQGYDQTTVDDIAARAGVGRTTFFRSFRSKEDVIFPDHDGILTAVSDRLGSSSDRTAVVAVADAARLVLTHYLAEGERARSRYELIRCAPALRNREIASARRYQRVFFDFIHAWMGCAPETALRAELMAAAIITAHDHVLRRWLRGLSHDVEAEFDAAIDQVMELYAERPQPSDNSDQIVVLRTRQDLEKLVPKLRRLLD